MKEIILASASPRRMELLRQIGLKFRVMPSNIEENIDLNVEPETTAMRLAYGKAFNIAGELAGGAIVIGADTIVVKDGILGKPCDEKDAFRMLKKLQGSWHEVITGVAVVESGTMRVVNDYERTLVKMRKLDDEEILSYIETGEPMDKAGAYGIQGLGAVLVERIEGCYSNVVGMPLSKLTSIMDEFGISILKKLN